VVFSFLADFFLFLAMNAKWRQWQQHNGVSKDRKGSGQTLKEKRAQLVSASGGWKKWQKESRFAKIFLKVRFNNDIAFDAAPSDTHVSLNERKIFENQNQNQNQIQNFLLITVCVCCRSQKNCNSNLVLFRQRRSINFGVFFWFLSCFFNTFYWAKMLIRWDSNQYLPF